MTTIEPWYISGFVDGEGSFHVAFTRRNDLFHKWVIIPEFHVNQHKNRALVLYEIQQFFQCGSIRENHANRQNDMTQVYVVRNRSDLLEKVIPFFRKYPLRSQKAEDFQIFSEIVTAMGKGDHRSKEGFDALARKAFQMNSGGRYRKLRLDQVLS